jgi:ribulose-5-phosphate 4-epimerase/fuculose-1-phosphate aldolase
MTDVKNQDRPPCHMSEAEWRARCDLAGLYRICDFYDWTDSVNTHLSARVPGEPDCFLINNYGELFNEITASSLVKVDLHGNILSKGDSFNPAGFTIHGGVYKARRDVNCVMHTHTRPGTGISFLKKGLRPISQDVLEGYDELAYHEYDQPTEEAEGEALGVSCQEGNAIILRNHGLLTVGSNVANAFYRMYMLNRACEIEIIARGLGEEPTPIAPEVVAEFGRRIQRSRATPTFGMKEWLAATRQIEGRGTDWRN